MQEPDDTNREDHPDKVGGKGGLLAYEPQTKGDLALVERAIRLRWPIREKARRPIMRKLERLAIESDDARTVIRAATAIMRADRINMDQEERDNPTPTTPQEHIHRGIIGIAPVRAELLNDPGYLDYQRSRALADDIDAGPVCAEGEQRQMANGKAPGGLGPGTNGHSNGTH